jgi:hypothetical protein
MVTVLKANAFQIVETMTTMLDLIGMADNYTDVHKDRARKKLWQLAAAYCLSREGHRAPKYFILCNEILIEMDGEAGDSSCVRNLAVWKQTAGAWGWHHSRTGQRHEVQGLEFVNMSLIMELTMPEVICDERITRVLGCGEANEANGAIKPKVMDETDHALVDIPLDLMPTKYIYGDPEQYQQPDLDSEDRHHPDWYTGFGPDLHAFFRNAAYFQIPEFRAENKKREAGTTVIASESE